MKLIRGCSGQSSMRRSFADLESMLWRLVALTARWVAHSLKQEDVRVAADYDEEPADEAIARKAVEGAEKFVAACQQFVAQLKR
jgi:hypothetical protein